jgi:hypothetical protein
MRREMPVKKKNDKVYDMCDISNMETGLRKNLEKIAQFCEVIFASYPTIWNYRSQEEKLWHILTVIIDFTRFKLGNELDEFGMANYRFMEEVIKYFPRADLSRKRFENILKKAYKEYFSPPQ